MPAPVPEEPLDEPLEFALVLVGPDAVVRPARCLAEHVLRMQAVPQPSDEPLQLAMGLRGPDAVARPPSKAPGQTMS